MTVDAPLVVQISRGLAPAVAIAAGARGAAERGWPYELVAGLAMVDAKNVAVARALDAGRDLFLLEDDVVAPRWPANDPLNVQVLEVRYPHAPGTNVYRRADGSILYAGTTAIRIPLVVLRALAQPLFAPYVVRVRDDRLALGGPRDDDRGSDIFFCWRCQEAGVRILCVERATTIRHALRGFPASHLEAISFDD